MNLEKLKDQFDPADIEFRAGATSKDKTKALALAYITSRAVMDRLDAVCGPENWQDEYRPGPDGGIVCGISICVDGQWVTKWDGAENTNFEAVKGGLSDAFKRAAVKWGIGRYLYGLDAVWVKATPRGNTVVIDETEARSRLFGTYLKKNNGNGVDPTFKTVDDLLYQICQDFNVEEDKAKTVLKSAGHNGFTVSKSGRMYQDAKAALAA